tara:strand:+ start:188 stop:1630 length:1443 start_codon:yes stop_codon:yes gene_type:complete
MSLTVVVGSSGSGKTTYLEDVHKLRKCTYIRQYHTLRPYIPVNKIPGFDPTQLPYWKLYSEPTHEDGKKNESYNPNIKIGGTMAGEFVAGLSGGQRKMMLFELVRQRTSSQSGLLILLDEPFAGVTDDFVPFIVERLNEIRKKHSVLLVTNDHVETLKEMADSTITVSAIDRSKIDLNGKSYDRELALHAVSDCPSYKHSVGNQDIMFFMQTELLTSPQVGASLGFMVFAFVMFLLSYWDSKPGSEALVLVAIQIISFFAINPFLIALADWREIVIQESDALMHCSTQTNLALKSIVTLVLLVVINVVSFGCLVGCIDGSDVINTAAMWVSMLFDSASLTLPFICFGLYSRLPLQIVQVLASLPFLFMIFFSTTFSPGAGLGGVKELRYLFARFYLWCRIPGVKENMDGCPAEDQLVGYTILTGCLGLIIFLVFEVVRQQVVRRKVAKSSKSKFEEISAMAGFTEVQMAMRQKPGQVQPQ